MVSAWTAYCVVAMRAELLTFTRWTSAHTCQVCSKLSR
jgi:hypothetical protein